MLLTITTTHRPATDLGYLLHKHPGRVNGFELNFGRASVFFPESGEERATAALLVEVDPVGLVRGREGSGRGGGGRDGGFSLRAYVNDRPYAASSFLSVAISEVYGSALNGHCKGRPELVSEPIPLEARVPVLPSGGGEALIERLFAPLGYELEVSRHPLDPRFPGWGESRYYDLRLSGRLPLKDLLAHLYVLVPVLDREKHYWVGEDEVEKLLAKGGEWLAGHPERELITARYLKYRRNLARAALARLVEAEGGPEAEEGASGSSSDGAAGLPEEERVNLHQQRLGTVLAVLRAEGARSVVDLGCGEGRLLERLLKETDIPRILGIDVSCHALERCAARLHTGRMPAAQRARLSIEQGSLGYRDRRLEGFDAAALVEVIEHLDPPRLRALEAVVFRFARPRLVALTTPNREYNALFEGMEEGQLRHRDHRFEWTRAEFEEWAAGVAGRHGYAVSTAPVGPEDAVRGAPSQLAVFRLARMDEERSGASAEGGEGAGDDG